MKEEISFDDLMKVDIRIGYVTKLERVEKADKLYKLEVDFGEEVGKRTVVSAIAHQFIEGEVLGHTFPFVINLAPRKIFGIESQAMILLAENSDGKYINWKYMFSRERGSVVL